ncbi:hypothetical protein ZOSMA_575G00030 [Zostera marina]|uniref:Uncharacterized protein n=1 Tax=Zostera marina TaxID=29655 RepID=A0A0K9NVG3_ZOSMR|nr:hypothetical protein ZOSMA_575G00030 [Zostera marina]
MHLDSALKDCMEEMRIGKEESEQKLHDDVFANTQYWEKLNLELEHLEDVKKITKLEAEYQRLRGLVPKKLSGPAALAQIKLVDADYGETRSKRERNFSSSPVKLQVST